MRRGTGRACAALALAWPLLLITVAGAAAGDGLPVRALGDGRAGAPVSPAGAPSAAGTAAGARGAHPVDGTPLVHDALPGILARAGGRGPVPAPGVEGAGESFFTIDLSQSPPDFVTIQATLRGESPTTRVYVEDDQWGARVGQAEVVAILAAFDQGTPARSIDPARGVAAIVETVFGPPTDIDGDGKIHILVLDIRDGFSGTGGYVAGYYTSHDQTGFYGSNQRDLLYVDSDPADPTGGDVLGTVAHEYQHLVHHRADPDEAASSAFMNEGLSELSTYLCGYGLRSPRSFAGAPDVALDAWGNLEPDYARVALWSVYLYEQLGLAGVEAVFAQPANGVAGIEIALAELGSPRDFATLLADWFVANAVNDAGADPRYGYVAWAGSVSPAASHASYPVIGSGAVQHRAADLLRFPNGEELTLTVDETGGIGLRARAVATAAPGAPIEVVDLALGDSWSAADLGAAHDEILLLAFTTGVFGADYGYQAAAVPGDVIELAYDDGVPEALGVMPPSPRERGVAVRFTLDEPLSALRRVQFYNGYEAPLAVHVWEASTIGAGPGPDLLPPVQITPPPGIGWLVVEVGDDAVTLTAGDLYVGLVVAGGDSLAVGLDDTPPYANRSWRFDSGLWDAFGDVGLDSTDLMIRLEIEVIEAAAPVLMVGVLQQPIFSEFIDVYVAADVPLEAGSLWGRLEHDDSPEALTFTPVGEDARLFVADGATLGGSGASRIIVSAAGLLGATVATDTLDFEAGWMQGAGGLLALAGSELELPAGALVDAALVTAQPDGVYPGGPAFGADAAVPVVTFGPPGLSLRRAAIVRLEATDGVVARWERGGWRPLPTRAAGGRLEASTGSLGSFGVVSGGQVPAPSPIRLIALSGNPVGREALLGLELASGAPSVQVRVYNVLGRRILSLTDGPLAAGSHALPLRLSGQPAGVYWIDAAAGPHRHRLKLVYVR